jgi:hypothetical protein
MLAVMRDMRKTFVEVFARVRLNLRILKGKIAGKRACWRTKKSRILIHLSVATCTLMLCRDCLWHARSWIHWGPSLRLEAVLMLEYGVKNQSAYPLGINRFTFTLCQPE